MSKKTTTATKTRRGAPTKYTREVILRFIKFMNTRNRLAVLPMHVVYNTTQKRVSMKHVPLLVAMIREKLNMTRILTKAGELKQTVLDEIASLKPLR